MGGEVEGLGMILKQAAQLRLRAQTVLGVGQQQAVCGSGVERGAMTDRCEHIEQGLVAMIGMNR